MDCGSGQDDIGYRRKTCGRRKMKNTNGVSRIKKGGRKGTVSGGEFNSHGMKSFPTNAVYF